MPTIQVFYGEEFHFLELSDEQIGEVLMPTLHYYLPRGSAQALIQKALAGPVGAPPLPELAKGKDKVVILADGAHRATPSRLTLPVLLAQIREGNPKADIAILVATADRGPMTREAMERRFGKELLERERFFCHDCDDEDALISVGSLPSGGELNINRLAAEADLLLAEGSAEPHYLAGFTGAAMAVLPGIAGRGSIEAAFGAAVRAQTAAGETEGNPLYEDIQYAAWVAKLAFTLDLVLNLDRDTVYAAAGSAGEAQYACEQVLRTECAVEAALSPAVLAVAGGAPYDETFYDCLRALAAAEQTATQGGTAVLIARCARGVGRAAPWQRELLARLLQKMRVICVSDLPPEELEALGVEAAQSFEEAALRALTAHGDAKLTVLPDATAVIVKEP